MPDLDGIARLPKEQVHNLVILLASPVSLEAQVPAVTRSGFYHLLLVPWLQLFLDRDRYYGHCNSCISNLEVRLP